MTLPKLLSIHWTGPRLLAVLVVAVGLWGTAAQLRRVVTTFPAMTSTASSPVVDNDQRRHAALLENQVKGYRGNLAAVGAFSVFVVLVTIHFVGLAWRMFAGAPLSSIVGGLFLGASGICGLLVGPAVARVNEFAFQAVGAQPAEREWLQAGMAFLNQLHLIFISGWLLLLGLGWAALGLGAVRMPGRYRFCGGIIWLGATMVLVSVGARLWLPTYGATAPGGVLLLSGEVFSLGIGAGLIGSGLLGWMLEGKDAPRMGHGESLSVVARSAKANEGMHPAAQKPGGG